MIDYSKLDYAPLLDAYDKQTISNNLNQTQYKVLIIKTIDPIKPFLTQPKGQHFF